MSCIFSAPVSFTVAGSDELHKNVKQNRLPHIKFVLLYGPWQLSERETFVSRPSIVVSKTSVDSAPHKVRFIITF